MRDRRGCALYNECVLSLTASIEIKELDAATLVSREVYDGNGDIIGTLSDEEYVSQVKEADGRAFFGLIVTVGDKVVQIRSEVSSPNPDTQRHERAHMLSQGFAQIGDSIYKNFAP